MNDTTTVTPICVNKTNTSWNNTKDTWNTTNTSVNTTNSTKHKEIQNLVAKIKINQAEIQGLNKEDKTLENQIPALLKQQKFVQVKDFIATIKKDDAKIIALEKQNKYLESIIDKLQGK